MTYIVSGGALKTLLTHSLTPDDLAAWLSG